MEVWRGLQEAGIGRSPFQINGVTSRKGTKSGKAKLYMEFRK